MVDVYGRILECSLSSFAGFAGAFSLDNGHRLTAKHKADPDPEAFLAGLAGPYSGRLCSPRLRGRLFQGLRSRGTLC
jgi:hypothetical protein